MAFLFWQKEMQMRVLIGVVMTQAHGPIPEMRIIGPTATSERLERWGSPTMSFPQFHHHCFGKNEWYVEKQRGGDLSATQAKCLRLCKEVHPYSTLLLPSQWVGHTSRRTPLNPQAVVTPSQMIPESRDRAGRIYHDAYTDIFTDQQISNELNTKDFETSSKSVKEEVERMHF